VGRVPESENRVTDIFHDGAVSVMNALRDGCLKIAVHVPRQLIRVHAFGDGREAGDVAEENRQRFLFRAGPEQFLVARKFFYQLRRKVKRQRLLVQFVLDIKMDGIENDRREKRKGYLYCRDDQPGKPKMMPQKEIKSQQRNSEGSE